MTKFWFTRSTGRLETGKRVQWFWDKQVTNSTQGFSLMLAGLKAYLEHRIQLNLVDDRYPQGIDH